MNQEIITSRYGGDSCLHVKHDSGLNIYIMEMPGYQSASALFGTKYGSINTRFRLHGESAYTEVPEGIAHFLEHKLFENEDCDAFARYARTGANANAYTSFDRTAYLFSCSDHFAESLEILLDFVQNPYFTQETVDKEQGIIAQEIRMNQDEPGWRVFFNMLRAMYHAHPVRIDIAGTEESIRKIDADLLYRCYHTFYNLHNMVLSVAGNVKAEEILSICDRLLKPCENQGLEQVFPEEPADVVQHETETILPVGTPIFTLGFKLAPKQGTALLRAEKIASVLGNMLFGESSALYNALLKEGVINSEFSADPPFAGDGFFCLSCSGESRQPELVRDRIFAEMERVRREGFPEEDFERLKRVNYGRAIWETNYVEANASMMLDAYMCGCKPFSSLDILADISYADVMQFLREEIDMEQYVLSVIRKQEN